MLSCFWVGFVERLTSVIRCKLCNYKQTTQDIFITKSSGYIGYYYYLRKCKSCVCFLGMYLVPIRHDHASLSLSSCILHPHKVFSVFGWAHYEKKIASTKSGEVLFLWKHPTLVFPVIPMISHDMLGGYYRKRFTKIVFCSWWFMLGNAPLQESYPILNQRGGNGQVTIGVLPYSVFWEHWDSWVLGPIGFNLGTTNC